MTHLWVAGCEVDVQAAAETGPLAFTWAGRLHRVASVCNTWRVRTAWWQQEIWRDYFKVQTEDGLLCTMYHDLLTDRWHLARVYD
jgi:hypothetical protein